MPTTLGKKIRNIRKQQKITQKRLAEKAGIANTTLCDIEKDRMTPSIKILVKIFTALNEPITNIFLDTNYENIVIKEKVS